VEILHQVFHQNKARKSLVFWWVPGHTGMPDSEAVLHGVCHLDELWEVMFAPIFFWHIFIKAG
jgi:hypothetical protein